MAIPAKDRQKRGGTPPPPRPRASNGRGGAGGRGSGGRGGGPGRGGGSGGRRPGGNRGRNRVIAVGAVVLIVVAVVVGLVVQSGRSSTSKKAIVPAAASLASGNLNGAFTRGNGPVLVEEYGDFQCPNCARYEETTVPTIYQLADQGKITFAFHNFPFLGPESATTGNAAVCASDVDKFWQMHDYLYAHQPSSENSGFWTTDQLLAAMQTVGAATTKTEQCVKDKTYVTWLAQQADAASKRGVTGTPTIFVNGQQITDQTPQGLTAAVDAASKK